MNPELVAVIENYARTHGLNLPPHQIVSDMVAEGPSGVEQLLAMLGTTINAGDPMDNAQAQAGHSEREAHLNDALTKFPANEEDAAGKLGGAGDPSQIANSIPQVISGVAGGIAGAVSGALQPFSQLAQQGLQAGLSAFQHGAGTATPAAAELPEELAGSESGPGFDGDELAKTGGGGGGGLGGTTPAAMLGPPPTPSPGTVPASSQTAPAVAPPPAEPAGAGRGPMGAMPMMPPGAMHGGGPSGAEGKADTKRVVPPSVKNGAPVQGRITAPPTVAEVVKRVEGKPVTTRRILAPDHKPDDDGANPGR